MLLRDAQPSSGRFHWGVQNCTFRARYSSGLPASGLWSAQIGCSMSGLLWSNWTPHQDPLRGSPPGGRQTLRAPGSSPKGGFENPERLQKVCCAEGTAKERWWEVKEACWRGQVITRPEEGCACSKRWGQTCCLGSIWGARDCQPVSIPCLEG